MSLTWKLCFDFPWFWDLGLTRLFFFASAIYILFFPEIPSSLFCILHWNIWRVFVKYSMMTGISGNWLLLFDLMAPWCHFIQALQWAVAPDLASLTLVSTTQPRVECISFSFVSFCAFSLHDWACGIRIEFPLKSKQRTDLSGLQAWIMSHCCCSNNNS